VGNNGLAALRRRAVVDEQAPVLLPDREAGGNGVDAQVGAWTCSYDRDLAHRVVRRVQVKGPPGNKDINYLPVSSVDSAKNWDVYSLADPNVVVRRVGGIPAEELAGQARSAPSGLTRRRLHSQPDNAQTLDVIALSPSPQVSTPRHG